MNVHVWLDASLTMLGLIAMSLCLWIAFCRRRSVAPSLLGRILPAVTILLFFMGLGSFTMAGLDVGLAAWEDAHRPRSEPFSFDSQGDSMPFIPSAFMNASHEEAPDFCLPALDENRSIRLSDFRGQKPVVLIFGSYG